MCYSAMVRSDLSKLARQMGASIDTEAFVRLYAMREKNINLKIPLGMAAYFLEEGASAGRSIMNSIKAYNLLEDARRKQELTEIETEILEIESRLKIKVTKTQQKALEVKSRKRDKILAKVVGEVEETEAKDAYRIYPFYFAPVVKLEKNARIITPMRYRILPRTGNEIPTKYNVFNARRDSLFKAATWKQTFGKYHAIFPFLKFYEWVEQGGDKVEVSFSPDGYNGMWAASLFEEYKDSNLGLIRSFAMVTDEPPPEVAAAGHDRCPVFLKESLLDEWLRPEIKQPEDLERLLDFKEPTHFSHLKAA